MVYLWYIYGFLQHMFHMLCFTTHRKENTPHVASLQGGGVPQVCELGVKAHKVTIYFDTSTIWLFNIAMENPL